MIRTLAAAAMLTFALLAGSPSLAGPAEDSAAALIAASGKPGMFENASTADRTRVRHRPSGAICAFGAETPRSLELTSDDPADDAFVCTTVLAGQPTVLLTLGLSPVRDARSLDATMTGAVQAILKGLPGAQPPVQQTGFRMGDAPVRDVTIMGENGGAPFRVHIRAVQLGSWVVLTISGSTPDVAAAADRLSGDAITAAVAGMAR